MNQYELFASMTDHIVKNFSLARPDGVWTRLSPPDSRRGDKWATVYEHTSGWQVRHCGHPTANWPYYLLEPGKTEIINSFNGRGFKTVEIACTVVERILAGEFHITLENCIPGVARVDNVTAFGEEAE